MSATAGEAEDKVLAERLGIQSGTAVQEIGWDEDCDDELRESIEAVSGEELLDEDSDEVVDVVLLWWREDDGDLADALVDAKAPLADNGQVVLLTPKTGRDGHVEPSDIADAATIAGLSRTSTLSAGKDWAATRLVTPKSARSKR